MHGVTYGKTFVLIFNSWGL